MEGVCRRLIDRLAEGVYYEEIYSIVLRERLAVIFQDSGADVWESRLV